MLTSYSKSWHQRASIRVKDPIELKTDSQFPLFPQQLQPLCQHPFIVGNSAIGMEYILTQVCYKYLQEICITETDVVNPTCLNIAYGNAPVQLTDEVQADAFTIIVDEAFHSYVARKFMLQVHQHTNIDPIIVPRENEVTKAVMKIKQSIPSELHPDFELVSTCISENIFTDEIIEVSKFKEVNESFHQVMVDHARDEGRHALYFITVMQAYWQQTSEHKRRAFVEIIPKFIESILDGAHESEYIKNLLEHCDLEEGKIKQLMEINYNEVIKQGVQQRMNNIVRFLNRSDVLNYQPLAKAIDAMAIN